MLGSRLDRYIARNVLAAIIVVQLVLLGLDLVMAFINDLKDVSADYSALDVLFYLGLRLPWRFYQYAPVAVLIGALIGLGSMASSNELTVMRGAGRSLVRIVWSAMKPILVVILVVLLIAEFVSPRTEQFAEAWRLEQLSGEKTVLSHDGGWQREGERFYRFGTIRADDTLIDLTRYSFEGTRLKEATHAARAIWQGEHWVLLDVETTRFLDQRTETQHHDRQRWETALTPAQLDRLLRDVETQSPSELWAYARYLKEQGLDATQPQLYFWQKILMPFTMASLVLVAASFVFGPLRSVAAGTRVFYGVIVGLSFKYLQDLLAPASTVFGFSPVWAVLTPTLVCVLVGFFLLRRSG